MKRDRKEKEENKEEIFHHILRSCVVFSWDLDLCVVGQPKIPEHEYPASYSPVGQSPSLGWNTFPSAQLRVPEDLEVFGEGPSDHVPPPSVSCHKMK